MPVDWENVYSVVFISDPEIIIFTCSVTDFYLLNPPGEQVEVKTYVLPYQKVDP